MERITIPGVGQFDRHTTALPSDCSQHVRLERVSFTTRVIDRWSVTWLLGMFLMGVLYGWSTAAGV